jgi:replicative DNA helicase
LSRSRIYPKQRLIDEKVMKTDNIKVNKGITNNDNNTEIEYKEDLITKLMKIMNITNIMKKIKIIKMIKIMKIMKIIQIIRIIKIMKILKI